MIIIKIKQSILIIVLVLLLSSSSYQADVHQPLVPNYKLNEVKLLVPAPITIDGIISPNEWDGAENVTKWFMDADPENYDGYNYMYIDEDADNLYVALDLVSDQTNNDDGEWVGIWLNTNNSISENATYQIAQQEWSELLNKGMESLIYDVQKNQTMSFFGSSDDILFYQFNSLSHLVAVDGVFEGSLADIANGSDNNRANMTSVYNGTHHTYRLDVEIPLKEYYKIFPDLYVDNTIALVLSGQIFNNETIDEHYLTIRDSMGNLLLGSTDQTSSITTGTTSTSFQYEALSSNFTQDDKVLFSFIGVNSKAFTTSFDRLYFFPRVQSTTYLGAGWIDYPYSSIDNYDIAWSFGPSMNNATSHRIFEMKIPKSELEGYTQDTDLGIMVGGYGTLSSWPNTHNWVFAHQSASGIPFEYSDEYHYYSMPMKGWTKANNPVLSLKDPSPSDTGAITLNWNTDPKIVNWTVLRYDSDITELNIDDVQVLGTGLTTTQLNDSITTNGLYYYAVVGIDTLGYAYLSNVVSVSVLLPTSTSSTTSTTTTSTSSSTNTTTSKGSKDGFLPGFVMSGSFITIFVTMFFYRKRK